MTQNSTSTTEIYTPSVGEHIGRYTVEAVTPLPDMQGQMVLLRHEIGARHMHIIRDDNNVGFSVTFPTVPKDSSGIAHILEHNVLMGSQRYPVPDPFFSMMPRSLNTFMNAITWPDWTTYPFSTRNEKDFYNLLGIYLDAAFFPLLRYESFRQDGHRFEYEDPADPTTPLKLQGVVYNEMKGAMATPGAVLFRAFGKALYPDLTYANNSGGNPVDIPTLTHEDLKAFHAAHYHPSNAYFYTYGNLNLPRVLDAIENQVMSRFSPQQLDVSIPDQTNFAAPRREEVFYPGSDTERGSQVVVGWKLGYSNDPATNLRWSVLADLLLGNPAAPLTHALIESGLGSALADLTGFQDNFREGAFTAGLKGLGLGQTEQVEALVLTTLKRLASEGIDPALVESSLHQFEIAQREVSNAGLPYSLKVMMRVIRPWMHGFEPASHLELGQLFAELRRDLAAGPVFEEMIRSLLDNPHRVTLTLTPDPEMATRTAADEAALVERLSQGWGDEDRQRVLDESSRLKELQTQTPDYSVLPSLSLGDIPTEVPRVPYTAAEQGNALVGTIPQPTGGISYLDVRLSLPALPAELRPYLSLYAYALTRSGAAGMDYLALARRIEAVTGGVHAEIGVQVRPDNVGSLRLSLTLSGKALARNGAALVEVLRDLIAAPEFTAERTEQLLKQRLAGLKASVVSSGHAHAMSLAAAQVSPAARIDAEMGGLRLIEVLKDVLDGHKVPEVLRRFEEIAGYLRQGKATLALTATPDDINLDLTPLTELFGPAEEVRFELPLGAPQPQARVTDSPVSFNALAYPTVPFHHPDSPALMVLAELFGNKYLFKEVREKGGAYGGFATFNPQRGVLALASYRDPHMGRTFDVFRQAADYLNTDISEQELQEAIISASSNLDPLTSPDNAGRLRFFGDLAGYTPEVQEAYKARLLKVTLDDLRRVAATYLKPEQAGYGLVSGQNPNEEMQSRGLQFEVKEV